MSPAHLDRVATFDLDDRVVQGAGVIQGGVLAGVLSEAVDDFAAQLVGSENAIALETLDVVIDSPALPGRFTLRASLVRQGCTLLVWDARLVDAAGKTVASGRTTHSVRAKRP